MQFKNKVILVTGGNSGIGRNICHHFAKEGATIALVGRNAEKGAQVASELSEFEVVRKFYSVDLSVEAQVATLIDEVYNDFGKIDAVINNAGIGARRSSADPSKTPGDRWHEMRGCNLDAAYFVSAYALKKMRRHSGGAMVNISSTATLHGNWGLYCVAKAGVEGLTRSFASEAAKFGIRVNGISPGWISPSDDFNAVASGTEDGKWDLPPSLLNRMGTPMEIATVAAFLVSDQASFVTGQTLIVDGGMTIIDYPSISMLDNIGHRLMSSTPKQD